MTGHRITAGFLPLTDSLVLVIAREKGFAAAEDVDLTLVREISWANVRDRIAVGQFDVAHMLAPMPIAASLGLSPIDVPVIAPFVMGLGGNAVTVSAALWEQISMAGAPPNFDPRAVGRALASVVKAGGPRLKLAAVHPYSSQNYELRYWLAASGIHPDRDVEIVIVPPPLMADALKAGRIDGYCVGEPWNSVAVDSGAGRIATVKAAIWSASPDKVLGLTEHWAGAHPDALASLLRALDGAARWCNDPANRTEAAAILARPDYLGVPAALVARALSGEIAAGTGETVTVPDFFVPYDAGANVPSQAQALWFYGQMVRWGQIERAPDRAALAAASYRPQLLQSAISAAPSVPHDSRFFDGSSFDAGSLDAYVTDQQKHDLLIS